MTTRSALWGLMASVLVLAALLGGNVYHTHQLRSELNAVRRSSLVLSGRIGILYQLSSVQADRARVVQVDVAEIRDAHALTTKQLSELADREHRHWLTLNGVIGRVGR